MTSIIRAGIRGDARANLRRAVTHCLPFTTSGSLAGATRDTTRHLRHGFYESGYLRGDDLAQFRADIDTARYVVWSYFTPIAWVREDGTAYYVRQKFSVTTSKHQGAIYGLGEAA